MKNRLAKQPFCWFCEKRMNCDYGKNNPLQATIDHLTPLSRGGGNGQKNKVLACRRCNSLKGSLTEEEFREAMKLPSFQGKHKGFTSQVKKIYPLSNVRLTANEKRRRKEAEKIRKSPIKQATVPPCLLWEH